MKGRSGCNLSSVRHPGLVGEKSFVVQPLTGVVSMGRKPDREMLHHPVPIILNHLSGGSMERHHLSISLWEAMVDSPPVPAVMAGAGVQQHDREVGRARIKPWYERPSNEGVNSTLVGQPPRS